MHWNQRWQARIRARGITIQQLSEHSYLLQRGEQEAIVHTENLRRQVTDPSQEEEETIHWFVQSVFASFGQKEVPQTRIFYPRLLPWNPQKKLSAPWSQVLVPEHVEVAIVEDLSTHFRFVQPMDLVRENLSLAQVKLWAKDNIAQAAEMVCWEKPADGVLIWESVDGLAAAMVLVLDLLIEQSVAHIAFPSRDALWVCLSQAELPVFVAKAQEAYRISPHPISGNVFSWTPDWKDRF